MRPTAGDFSVSWRTGPDLLHGVYRAQAVPIGHRLYLGGGDTLDRYSIIQEYNSLTSTWAELSESPVERPALTALSGQLVLAGSHAEGSVYSGKYSHSENNTRITVWDSESADWFHPYPHMETGRSYAAAVSFQKHLVIAGGLSGGKAVGTVEVLDCAASSWHQAEPIPLGGHHMSSAVINNYWYVSAHYWSDDKPHVFFTHLPSLVASATTSQSGGCTWYELASPPVKGSTLLTHNDHLLLAGGLKRNFLGKEEYQEDIYSYQPSTKNWLKCAKLPRKMSGCSCARLGYNALLVTGGFVKGNVNYSRNVWIGNVN